MRDKSVYTHDRTTMSLVLFVCRKEVHNPISRSALTPETSNSLLPGFQKLVQTFRVEAKIDNGGYSNIDLHLLWRREAL
jgi:hypothetical protein